MSSISVAGDVSGAVSIVAPSVAGTTTLTGKLTISNSSISGLFQLSTLTYLPVFPDISPKMASTAFVSTNFCDLSTTQTITRLKHLIQYRADKPLQLQMI